MITQRYLITRSKIQEVAQRKVLADPRELSACKRKHVTDNKIVACVLLRFRAERSLML